MRSSSQEQEAAQESEVTGSCMGGAGGRRLSRDILRAQRKLAFRAVGHCHHHAFCLPLCVLWPQYFDCPALHAASVEVT